MPTHVYYPSRNPPTWWDRVLVHSTDNAVAVLAVMFGAFMGFSLLFPEFNPSTSMSRMPWPILMIISGFIGNGGVLALIGLHWTGDTVSKGWALERLGWIGTTGGFTGYAIAVAWHFPGAVFGWLWPIIFAAASLLRVVSLILIEYATRKAVAEVKQENGGTVIP